MRPHDTMPLRYRELLFTQRNTVEFILSSYTVKTGALWVLLPWLVLIILTTHRYHLVTDSLGDLRTPLQEVQGKCA